jgi:hypothetical protein
LVALELANDIAELAQIDFARVHPRDALTDLVAPRGAELSRVAWLEAVTEPLEELESLLPRETQQRVEKALAGIGHPYQPTTSRRRASCVAELIG